MRSRQLCRIAASPAVFTSQGRRRPTRGFNTRLQQITSSASPARTAAPVLRCFGMNMRIQARAILTRPPLPSRVATGISRSSAGFRRFAWIQSRITSSKVSMAVTWFLQRRLNLQRDSRPIRSGCSMNRPGCSLFRRRGRPCEILRRRPGRRRLCSAKCRRHRTAGGRGRGRRGTGAVPTDSIKAPEEDTALCSSGRGLMPDRAMPAPAATTWQAGHRTPPHLPM